MAAEDRYDSNSGISTLVTLGRWAGFFTIASALAIGVWQTIIVSGQTPLGLDLKIFTLWRAVIQIAPLGVIIILLAELADRLWYGGEEETLEDELPGEDPPEEVFETAPTQL